MTTEIDRIIFPLISLALAFQSATLLFKLIERDRVTLWEVALAAFLFLIASWDAKRIRACENGSRFIKRATLVSVGTFLIALLLSAGVLWSRHH